MDNVRFNSRFTQPVPPFVPKAPIKKRAFLRNFSIMLSLLVFVGAIFAAAFFYFKAQKLESQSQVAAAVQATDTIAEVQKLIVLPTDEDPTVATVSDVEKLRSQPFFADAKDGDKVLIYTKAQKAILYDPTAKKVVEIAPLNTNQSTTTQQ